MKLSTKARYGTRAMVELAAAYPDRAVSVKEMGERQLLSLKYLEQIMAALKAAGLIRAVRGVHGGYALTRDPSTIKLTEVFQAVEGVPTLVECVGDPGSCPMRERCPTRGIWVEMTTAIRRILDGTTLADLVDSRRSRPCSLTPMYHI